MSYTHLSPEERFCIVKMRYENKSIRFIAQFLLRAASTISREIKRNSIDKVYWNDTAQHLANQRKAYPRTHTRHSYAPLYDLVIKNLMEGLSPDVISGRLKRETRSKKLQVSHETIYQWILTDAKHGGVLYKLLHRHHKKRHKQGRGRRRRTFKDQVSISKRPKVVEDKVRFGDWESDTMEGGKSLGGLATHAERKSRYLVAGKLTDKLSSTFMDASIKAFKHIDDRLIKTFTVDNGSEFAEFKYLEKETKSKVYFAQPSSPWQRGLNEHTNGLLRRNFPKGCNFHKIDDSLIQQVVNKLNHTPRKSLKYRTPYEVLFKTRSVALRT